MRVLVLGASGMLGNAIVRILAQKDDFMVFGTLRGSQPMLEVIAPAVRQLQGIYVDQQDSLLKAFTESRPDVVINCVGLVKQLANADDPLEAIPINSLLPHRLARMCELVNARLIHISTDCVFSGQRGGYRESDEPDSQDLYGRSKFLGEVSKSNAITLRTSIIGHELNSANGLVGWFLGQNGTVKGYRRAIFSGLPTCELGRIIRDEVIPRVDLHGVYHVASEPISKYELLHLIKQIYGKDIEILPDDCLILNRSLNSDRFREATNYVPPDWASLILQMKAFQ
jgi:dTDP-4-dehydrorhamnose reductase